MKNLARGLMVAMLILLAGAAFAQDYDEAASISFVVLKDYNGKPIRNASVVMHSVNKKGKQEQGDLELKADSEGKCSFDGIPYGKLRVQVLAPGFQTFGEDYDIEKPSVALTIRLKRPGQQYSIYTDHQNDKKDDTNGKPPANDGEKPKQ